MALIKCGECGKEVSDKAEACPNCGNPIAIKYVELRFVSEFVINYRCYVYDAESGEELWEGKQGETAVLDTNNEAKVLAIKINGGNGKGEIKVKPGDKLLIRSGLGGIKYQYVDEPDHSNGGISIGFGKFW